MLVFMDLDKWVKVLRPAAGAAGRTKHEMLGLMAKRDMQIPPALMEKLNPQELAQLNRMLEIRHSADQHRLRYQALNFPATAREVIDYFERSTNEVERALIATTIVEASRRIRLAEGRKVKSDSAPPAKAKLRMSRPRS
jgi:hypothetical protein